VRLLLDTHIALWAITDSPRLSQAARELILGPQNIVFFSAASVWEIAIKHGLGRGDMPVSGARAAELFLAAGYLQLPISAEHAAAIEALPLLHTDPFDRLLVAQALTEPLRLLTHDQTVASYGNGIQFV
jgi:PIN domain nuclease of toxin-antitoxin system